MTLKKPGKWIECSKWSTEGKNAGGNSRTSRRRDWISVSCTGSNGRRVWLAEAEFQAPRELEDALNVGMGTAIAVVADSFASDSRDEVIMCNLPRNGFA